MKKPQVSLSFLYTSFWQSTVPFPRVYLFFSKLSKPSLNATFFFSFPTSSLQTLLRALKDSLKYIPDIYVTYLYFGKRM